MLEIATRWAHAQLKTLEGKQQEKNPNIQFIMEFSIYIYWNDDKEIVLISTFSS